MVGLISNKRIIQKGKQHDKWLEQQIQIWIIKLIAINKGAKGEAKVVQHCSSSKIKLASSSLDNAYKQDLKRDVTCCSINVCKIHFIYFFQPYYTIICCLKKKWLIVTKTQNCKGVVRAMGTRGFTTCQDPLELLYIHNL
jgi:hypothetical protein